MKLADYLKQYRKENNLTQQELADKLFVSKQAVSKWETERGLPDIETYKSTLKMIKDFLKYKTIKLKSNNLECEILKYKKGNNDLFKNFF